MAEQIKMNIPIDSLKDQICECTNALWLPAMQLKAVPPLYSQTGTPQYLMIQIGFLCTACGTRIPLQPITDEEKRVITFPGREN
jgi:hypothetical protein